MPRLEKDGLLIKSAYDLQRITHYHEREFARYLGTQEDIQVKYEAAEFQVERNNPSTGKREQLSHLPDFQVVDLKSGEESFIEITTSPFVPECTDPKRRQKNIMNLYMQELGEEIIYVVLYQHNLRNLQQEYPELVLDFFNRANSHISSK